MRGFWLTLFALGAVVVLRFGWQTGEPWTATAFVAFFISRVWRSLIWMRQGERWNTTASALR